MLSIEDYRKIYNILDRADPAPYDCGRLCGSICCSDASFDGEESYIYLLPGENEYLRSAGSGIRIERQKRDEHDLPASWGEYVYIARCLGRAGCDRRNRPIQCRTFPLHPYVSEEGVFEMVMCYMDIPYPCPFIEGKESLSDEFGRAVYEAWQMLIKDSAIMDLVIQDSKQRRMRERVRIKN